MQVVGTIESFVHTYNASRHRRGAACCTEDGGKKPAGSTATAAVSKPTQTAGKVITK